MPVDYAGLYQRFAKSVFSREQAETPLTTEQTMGEAIGGQFDKFGALMLKILIEAGLRPEHYLIDVGCGSGRLTRPAASYLIGRYLGTDVVPALLDNARQYGKPGWRFEEVSAIAIPEEDLCTDMVCFFSVLTHLLHEDAFRYLREAKRVLKSGARIVFSFLEFRVYSTRVVFRKMVADKDAAIEEVMNQFISRDAIEVWADELGLKVVTILAGDEKQIAEDGSGTYNLGQSICVLEKDQNRGTASECGAVSQKPVPIV